MKPNTLLAGAISVLTLLAYSSGAQAAGDPASRFCESQGGQVQVLTDRAGAEMALCNLPDGTSIEAWSYYRMGDPNMDRPIGMADPASIYCEEQGGALETVKDRSGGELSLCSLPDGRILEAWSFYRMQQ